MIDFYSINAWFRKDIVDDVKRNYRNWT